MIVTYHNIGQTKGFNTVGFEAFQLQIQHLKKFYRVVDLDQYVNQILRNGKNAMDEVAITFDDGYTSFIELAMPFLKTQDVPVALFICNSSIGKSNHWDSPEVQLPIMSEQQLKELSRELLVTIGAHSISHRSLSNLPKQEMISDLEQSKRGLEQLLNRPVQYLAYPFGQHYLNVNKQVFNAAEKAGFKAAFTSNFKNVNSADHLFALNRLDITGADTLGDFKVKLKTINYYRIKQWIKNGYSLLKMQ